MQTTINKIKQLTTKVIIAFALALAITGLVSCDKQINVEPDYADGLTIRFQAPPSILVETETKDATIRELIITDAWVFQYGTDGTLIKKQYKEGSNITQGSGPYLAEVATDGFQNVDSRFYVIVNGGELLFKDITYTEAQVKSTTMAVGSDITSELSFLTAGPIDFKKQEVDNGKAILVAPLERTYAKINLYYTSKVGTGSFSATGAYITNISTVMAVSKRGGNESSGAYPAIDKINKTLKEIDGTTNGWGSNKPKSFYIAENLRGFGTSTTFAGKSLTINGPDKSLDGCTCVTIKGIYKYDASHENGIEVEYRFYLGGNLMNDYNVQRGTTYTIAVNIAGANSADVRVTITKGNIVLFDKVELIERTVDFK